MIVTLLAKEFEVAKSKYFREHRKLVPEQVPSHRARQAGYRCLLGLEDSRFDRVE
jgi:hypothetical protein